MTAAQPGSRCPSPWSLLLLATLVWTPRAEAQLLAPVFRDHAVLQRDRPAAFFGRARPGETVTVIVGRNSASAVADASGRWMARLPALPAGGGYEVSVRGSNGATQVLSDVLVGDVFLCSGQSNMAMSVGASRNGAFEAVRASDSRIRMLTVPEASNPAPQEDFGRPVTWQVASPQTVGAWSAACYFMARELRAGPLATGDVPVGLITAAWGGSNIRAWLDAQAFADVGGYETELELLRLYTADEPRAQQAFGARWQDWWLQATSAGGAGRAPREVTTEVAAGIATEVATPIPAEIAPQAPWLAATGAAWTPAPDGLGDWTRWPDLRGFTGMVWFRATAHLTDAQAAQPVRLALGAVDEVDQTWMNGRVVANTFGYGTARTYDLPLGTLQPGENVLVVNVLNTWATGGLIGDHSLRALHLADGTRIELTDWRYLPVREAVGGPPRAPWESVGGMTGIHNGMVAPLGPFGVRGVVWYQGESNTGDGPAYEGQMRALIRQWRRQFAAEGVDGPAALIVQLPNFGRRTDLPVESGWADVREAQRRAALAEDRAAVAITIDVGEAADIHPIDKQTVGARLARAARRVVYGEKLPSSGPTAMRAVRRGDLVVVSFVDIADGLVAYGATGPVGFQLCGDGPGTCRFADARVDGADVHVRADDAAAATHVRYAWADNPVINLFDLSGQPVGPFQIAIEHEP